MHVTTATLLLVAVSLCLWSGYPLALLLPASAASTDPACRAQMPTCAPGAPCADLRIDGVRAQTSAYVTNTYLSPTNCAVIEGCAQAGNRKLLRFDMVSQNSGTADLILGDPQATRMAPCFEWGSCHNHYHFTAYAEYSLMRGSTVVARGAKASSCLLDSYKWDTSAPTKQRPFNCGNQGISRGYEDVYGSHLDCQWIDVTGIAPGTYTLLLEVNKDRVLPESNYNNNAVSVPVVVPADSDLPPPPDPSVCSNQGGCSSCANTAGCGWCSSTGGCSYGTYLGPASGTCSEWTWSAAQCSAGGGGGGGGDGGGSGGGGSTCAAQRTCGTCAAQTGCGWCISSNSCLPGTTGGSTGGVCTGGGVTWQFGANNRCGNCPAQGNCGDCTGATGCGWCSTTGSCTAGTWLGPAESTCPNAWRWSGRECESGTTPPPTTSAPCAGSALTVSGSTARGTCPSGSTLLASGSSCQLACNTGYTLASGGTKTCTSGSWSGPQPTCTPNSCTLPSSAPAGTSGGCVNGATLANGASCTYTVQSGWTLQSGSLQRTCQAGAFTSAAPVLTQAGAAPSCSSRNTCTTCAATSGCGWCISSNSCLPGTAGGSTGGVCTGGGITWQFGANNRCGNCPAQGNCGDCTGATGCGWCSTTGSCTAGTWLGPAESTCPNAWKWSGPECSAPPPSSSDSCAIQHDCGSCATTRGCGWCPSANTCLYGTWTGPATGSCPAWVWSAATCTSAATLATRLANPSLTDMVRLTHIGRSMAASLEHASVDMMAAVHPALDPQAKLASTSLTLDEVLKCDISGNLFKEPDVLSVELKKDAAGNFLKLHPSIDVTHMDRPLSVKGRRRLASGELGEAGSIVDIAPLPYVDPYDPDPYNPLLPHGHVEHIMRHSNSTTTDSASETVAEGSSDSVGRKGDATHAAAITVSSALVVVLAVALLSISA